MAWKDARGGGKGRANAILVLGLDDLKDVYRLGRYAVPGGGGVIGGSGERRNGGNHI